MSEEIIASLRSFGIIPIILPPDNRLSQQISNHTDLSVFYTGEHLLFHNNYFCENSIRKLLEDAEVKIPVLLSDSDYGNKYPDDVGLCSKFAGNMLFCNRNATDPLIIEAALKEGKEIRNIRQGYAACSICVTYDGSVITSDKGIARECEIIGVDSLLITPGHIYLPGYGSGCEGFIGGCSGLYNDTLFFTGDLLLHPDGNKIIDFCANHRTNVKSLSSGFLTDIGGMIFISNPE